MFEYATKHHFRFGSSAGLLTTEDLWSLPLQAPNEVPSLEQVAQSVYADLQAESAGSFVVPTSSKKEYYTKQLDLVKHIIAVRQQEVEDRRTAAARADQKVQLLEILHSKKLDNLKGLSVEELENQLNELS